ncbi:TetR/AcrR family transcriptional regulator [Pelagicoccus albus]|uniref:TetR/AcrR family transcriptional regulator n=1 Tax=Pelagicoccus albus TaxID=415222 RepID=A0A7X1B3U1_9BACT|nr:TetR/AcrR family transcriptional regulator [Pelagicoccus albus]MBC2605027.1 TetR/AcrR family transcriptional regulator [Pelagicoccus albus]
MTRAQFDRTEIIERSIDLFWQNGYTATSMQKLVKATGLKPGSLYLAFGNKEGLYRESLAVYAETNLQRIRETIHSAPSIEAGLIELLRRIVEETKRKDYCSCFLLKTQLELAAEGNELYQLAEVKVAEIEDYLQSELEEIYPQETAMRRASSLMLQILGVRIYGYRSGSAQRMWFGLKEALPWLPWPCELS